MSGWRPTRPPDARSAIPARKGDVSVREHPPPSVRDPDGGDRLRAFAASRVDEGEATVARDVERVPAQPPERAGGDVDADCLRAPLGREPSEERDLVRRPVDRIKPVVAVP